MATEVPVITNETVKWLNVRVPSTSIVQPSSELHTPPINDASSMCIIRHNDYFTTYFIWRINKTRPNVLEIVQLGSFTEFPRAGLRIMFTSALCPFASICKNEIEGASMNPYMLYTLSVDGVAYLIKLNNLNDYGSCSVFPTSDVFELNTCSYGDGTITAIAATTGFFVIGKEDGSLSCFRLGSLDSTSQADHVSPGAWKLYYYQRVMQIFEQYNMSAGACQFALAALEQVDEVLGLDDIYLGADFQNEEPNLVKGRLWANVFKLYLDLNKYHDAYCAIISNPDEESKYICLRRFIHVLFKNRAIKILCDGSLPFDGLAEKVEQELALKAKHSDVSVKPNPLKVLYAFAIHRCNWRKAASYMYLYSRKLKSEAAGRDYEFTSFALQERLNCLSATINVFHLLSPSCAWISTLHPDADDYFSSEKTDSWMDIEKLENEFTLTSAEHLLSMKNIKWSFTGIDRPPSNLIELLVQSNLYDMVFTVILRFYKGSTLKRELERVFSAMSRKCCLSRNDTNKHGLLVASKDEVAPAAQHSKGNDHWDALEQYMGIYKSFHPRLPVIVAETLLSANSLMKLPLWLVEMFKGTLKGTLGMAGSESSPASLFQVYVDYGQYAEATNLVLHYLETVASLRPEDVIRRKKPSAVWFPYTTIERLKCKLDELINSGQMVVECEKQRNLLETALLKHFQLLQSDSDNLMEMSFETS